jgi:sortase A
VAKNRSPEDLSVDELRWLLMEKRRSARRERLEHYRQTGRAIRIASDQDVPAFDSWRTEAVAPPGQAAPRSSRKRILDGLLLVVEISAIAGFLFILFSGLSVIRQLNQEVASAIRQPTLTPTPLVAAVVLPSGHTPPNAPGGTRFNEAEIPEHLRTLVQMQSAAPPPTPSPGQAVRIRIPAIRVDAPVVQGDSWEQLKKGVAQHAGTVSPGQPGNVVLSAHNDVFGEIFRDLDQLKPGDPILLHTGQQVYRYVVVDSQIVDPGRVEVMNASLQPVVTLISCYPYLVDHQRIVITARLTEGG